MDESRALTGLRGLAALLVLAHHVYLHLDAGFQTDVQPLHWGLRKGYLGVDLFFVLSGFVMSMVYGGQFLRIRPGAGWDYLGFLVRRVARIWPLHALLVFVVLAGDWALGRPPFSPRVVLENLLMVQAWGHSTEINAPAWSISTEFVAYLLFPLLAGAVLRGRARLLACGLGVIAALALCTGYAPPIGPMRRGELDIYYNFSALPTLRCLAGFVTGMLAWRAGCAAPVQAFAARAWLGPAALVAMLAAMLAGVDDRLTYVLLPFIVVGFHYGTGPVQRALGRGPLHRLGVLSYAIYLIHYVVLQAFPFQLGPPAPMLAAYVAAVLLLAALAHGAIERPARRVLRAAGARTLAVARRACTPLQERAP